MRWQDRARAKGVAGARRAKDELRPYVATAVGVATRRVDGAARRVGRISTLPTPPEILAAYTRGWVLFGQPRHRLPAVHWELFPTRAIITPESAKVPKRLRTIQRRDEFEVRIGEDFEAVIEQCRVGRSGWLTTDAVEAYRRVHDLGCVSTVATYHEGRLAGGLWGIQVGRTLGIMSMFHNVDHAGALALAAISDLVAERQRWTLVDCGGMNENFRRYGAYEVPTEQFCELVWRGMAAPEV
jgi:leucyl/phenylalanyl-tRNA---protein transferase